MTSSGNRTVEGIGEFAPEPVKLHPASSCPATTSRIWSGFKMINDSTLVGRGTPAEPLFTGNTNTSPLKHSHPTTNSQNANRSTCGCGCSNNRAAASAPLPSPTTRNGIADTFSPNVVTQAYTHVLCCNALVSVAGAAVSSSPRKKPCAHDPLRVTPPHPSRKFRIQFLIFIVIYKG